MCHLFTVNENAMKEELEQYSKKFEMTPPRAQYVKKLKIRVHTCVQKFLNLVFILHFCYHDIFSREIHTRECLDRYLAAALNIPLDPKTQRIKAIDDNAYVLTLDFFLKVRHNYVYNVLCCYGDNRQSIFQSIVDIIHFVMNSVAIFMND